MKNIKKRTKIIAIVSVVLVVVILGYLIVTQRFSADTLAKKQVPLTDSQISAMIEARIKKIPLSVTLAKEANSFSEEHLIGFIDNPLVSSRDIAYEIYDRFISYDLNGGIISLFSNKYKPNEINKNGSYEANNSKDKNTESCKYTVSNLVTSGTAKSLDLAGNCNFSVDVDATLPSIYKSDTQDYSGEEGIIKKITVSYNFNAKLVSVGTNWKIKSPATISILGNSSVRRYVDMDAFENLLRYKAHLEESKGNISDDSYWQVTTKGIVDFSSESSLEINNLVLPIYNPSDANSLERVRNLFKTLSDAEKKKNLGFCVNTCTISIEENLYIKAKKTPGASDGPITSEGTIESYVDHTETYTGVGKVDSNGNKISWKSLTLDKTDKRNWDQNLTYSNGKVVRYIGSIDTKGIFQPLIKDKMNVTSEVTRDITISYKPASKLIIPTKNIARVYKKETNTDGKVIRTGAGYSEDCYGSNPCITKDGVFDNTDSNTIKLTSPENLAGQVVSDPFLSSNITPYTKTFYDNGSLYVPGLFTSSYKVTDTLATISTPALKKLPAKLYVFRSYDKDDKAFKPESIKPFNLWLNGLKNKGVTVIERDTTSSEKFKKSLSGIENGSWVLNMGHGGPLGLVTGLNDGDWEKHYVEYAEMQNILLNKGIKIDVFAADSCYSARAGIAGTVIGSTGVGFSGDGTSLGSIIGIGNNSWNNTADDLINTLNEIIAKSPKNPAVTPKVSLPVKPSISPVITPKVTLPPTPLVSPKISPTVSLPIVPSAIPTVTPKVSLPPMPPAR